MKHKTLHELLSIQSGSVNNLASYSSKTYSGSLLQASKDIKKYLQASWIQQIPFDIKPRDKRKQYFYFVTREGAKAIDRLDDYKQKITKSLNNAEHESMKFDIALSFIRNFPNYDFDFNYKADLGGLKPDILIKAKNINDHKEFTFLVEIERKKEMTRIHRDKIYRYNKFIKNGLFEKKIFYKPKILFVCANLRYDPYLRPQQYNLPEVKKQTEILYKHFDDLMDAIKSESDKYYRFLPYPEYQKISDKIWRMPSGSKVKIID